MKIYLVGYMGSGKSTLGRELARRLDLRFIDMDKYIENKHGTTIAHIFADEGENSFREKEHDCLVELSQLDDVVIATGGGVPCGEGHMELMNASGTCVFLDVDEQELVARLLWMGERRPLVKGKTPEELSHTIGRMLRERRPHYEKAKYVVAGKTITVNDIINIVAG